MCSPLGLLHCAFTMFVRNGTNVPMPDCPRLKKVSKVFRVGMPKKEVEDTPTIIAVQQRYSTGVPSNIWWVYTPQIFDGTPSVKYLVGLQPPNI